ncbi:MAG: hypothetical protein DMF00_13195 [Verrucomicrobia bacterium]|nr:MAG: hypothetical protein DMF00_13195 [Verrucomicrobiota bacterium]
MTQIFREEVEKRRSDASAICANLRNPWMILRRTHNYNSLQSSTILPELPDFISSMASLNCV